MLHSAGAPCRGTVCHTHSVRSGTTLTDKVYNTLSLTGNGIRDSDSVSTALRWGALHGDSLQHTLIGIRDNSDDDDDDDEVMLNVLRCQLTLLGTSCDQCRSMVQYSFTSTETRRLVRTDSPARPPRLSHSS